VRAIVRAQGMLKKDPARATDVGRRRFPPDAAEIIATVVERDLPFYDPVVGEDAVAAMNAFARALGLLTAPVAYEDVVATRFRTFWTPATAP
jgi:ABC-type nitrate/sulfonate/bicarbonate transport system substrate-binding protein